MYARLKHIANYFLDCLQLIFPAQCLACGSPLRYSERILCTSCLIDLPRVYESTAEHGALDHLFAGQIPYERASALMYYTKKNKYASLLHALKYKGNKDVGIFLGELCAQHLHEQNCIESIDCIVPVPLHSKRRRTRGYNQSEVVAQGISHITKIPVCASAVVRRVNTETQTKKNKDERKQNVANIFSVAQANLLEHKHILLLDDVITTGATTISCAETILRQVPSARISIVGVALAHH
ncbi:MAG: ComF family protein [Bacteroidales bacterium]|jgi:ComF family protein|nr:ComF family protein [Bacteroidales bacterium]